MLYSHMLDMGLSDDGDGMTMEASILFLLGSSGVGGVERVSVVLANEFVSRGLAVTFCAFKHEERNFLERLDKRICVVHLKKGWLTAANRRVFRSILIDRHVTHIINQWCVPFAVTTFCRRAARGLGIALIAVHHNIPTMNKRIQDSSGIRRKIWQVVSAINIRLVYEFSDAYVLLSESFVDIFKRFVWLKRADKLRVITNPLTMAPVKREKENLIIYVGRLEETQKRVSRVIEIWRHIAEDLPDWKLEIVGDGPDRVCYEERARGLPRISFEGFQDPASYYARAKLLLLTSDFEGFGLVLIEAMASCCLPVVLGSYPAAYDIVRGGVVEPAPFKVDDFVLTIKKWASDSKLFADSANVAEMVKKDYGVSSLADKWEFLFREVLGKENRHEY